ncbi:hypothetical protein C8R45DRAFT_1027339, partial [Mycena sanguinolenta]
EGQAFVCGRLVTKGRHTASRFVGFMRAILRHTFVFLHLVQPSSFALFVGARRHLIFRPARRNYGRHLSLPSHLLWCSVLACRVAVYALIVIFVIFTSISYLAERTRSDFPAIFRDPFHFLPRRAPLPCRMPHWRSCCVPSLCFWSLCCGAAFFLPSVMHAENPRYSSLCPSLPVAFADLTLFALPRCPRAGSSRFFLSFFFCGLRYPRRLLHGCRFSAVRCIAYLLCLRTNLNARRHLILVQRLRGKSILSLTVTSLRLSASRHV